MENIIKKAQAQFREIQVLLSFPDGSKSDYFTKLSIATEEAYFTMNSGMCSNTAVCKNCLKHRDFIRSLMDILGELEVNSTGADKYSTILSEYLVRVNAILERISTIMSSPDTSRLKYGLPL
ncbi:MAG: hypothetical protein JZU62_09500 [Sulfuricurvum sp.]|uniref:hypothetical protein n=1 Tax=Sulfuricurvum sp. TaxID=2025608 RepID=UPI0025F59F7F|nr:hypothetical protein [Sulfuricurvum sp.]MBV5321912.1 hypothetical protein [Sulfuricurvum sp.]